MFNSVEYETRIMGIILAVGLTNVSFLLRFSNDTYC